MISGKLIEYMATGNPVLVIGDLNSEVSDLMKISLIHQFVYQMIQNQLKIIF